MREHAGCATCKCEPQYVRDEFRMEAVDDKDLATWVGLHVAEYVRRFKENGKDPYKLDFQVRFEYDPRYLRDKLVIVRKNPS